MAVYERSWRRFSGRLGSLRWRFLVVTRFALREVFSSRMFTAFYVLCAIPSVVGLFLVYFSHNLGLLRQLGLTEEFMEGLTLPFFQILFSWQATPAFLVAVIVAPTLLAADLANGALPLYLSRPLRRADYVLGKLAVLGTLLSPITWMPGISVWALQAYLEGGGWWWSHRRIGIAYLVGHLTWIVVISLLSVALSAWLRHRWAARAGLLGLFFVLGGLASTLNLTLKTHWGDVLNLGQCIALVLAHLFDPTTALPIPVAAAWASLVAASVFSLLLLNRKLRAHEVVR
jgi:ABC-2 type transport system permease protein